MVTVREVIEQADLDAFGEVLAEDVVWVGLSPGELCRTREQVLEMLGRGRSRERTAEPEIVAERDDKLVVDPHLADAERHQLFVVSDGLVSEIRSYPDRATALAALETQW
jgi:ketosteroid isomerase-like protein